MNIEHLKVIAKGMGYKAKVTPSRCSIAVYPYSHCPKLVRWKLYNPDTNNDQMVEIIKKCMLETTQDGGLHYARQVNATVWMLGRTINEAVCIAAYGCFK